jgi:hypothetical protein
MINNHIWYFSYTKLTLMTKPEFKNVANEIVLQTKTSEEQLVQSGIEDALAREKFVFLLSHHQTFKGSLTQLRAT